MTDASRPDTTDVEHLSVSPIRPRSTRADQPGCRTASHDLTGHDFGEPSSFGLSWWELARHVRQLRRDGWQSWELRVRFDFQAAA